MHVLFVFGKIRFKEVKKACCWSGPLREAVRMDIDQERSLIETFN